MDPKIRNFSQIKKFIKENPAEADARAFEWDEFLKVNAETSPEIFSIETSEEFYKWAQEHPEKNIDPSVWVGKEIEEAYFYLREQREYPQTQTDEQTGTASIPLELAAFPILAGMFLERPKIIEEDRNYQQIEEELKKEWIKKNPGKEGSKEHIDYLYGSLDGQAKNSLDKEAKEAFEKNPKFKKRAERYRKETRVIYKNPKDDQKWLHHEYKMQAEINARLELLEKKTKNTSTLKVSEEEFKKYQNDIIKQVRMRCERAFVEENPEKGKAYLKNVAESIENEKTIRLRLIERNEALMGETSAFEQEVGGFTSEQPMEKPHIINAPSPTTIRPEHAPSLSRPPEKGISSRIINAANKLPRIRLPRNPFKKTGSLIIRRGLIAILANWWIALLLGGLFAIVLIIALPMGGSASNACPSGSLKKIFQTEDSTLTGTPTTIKKSGDKIYLLTGNLVTHRPNALYSAAADGTDLKMLKDYSVGYAYATLDTFDGNAYVVSSTSNNVSPQWTLNIANESVKIEDIVLKKINGDPVNGYNPKGNNPIISVDSGNIKYSSYVNYGTKVIIYSGTSLLNGSGFNQYQQGSDINGKTVDVEDYTFTGSSVAIVYKQLSCSSANIWFPECYTSRLSHTLMFGTMFAGQTNPMATDKLSPEKEPSSRFTSLNAQLYGDEGKVYFSWRKDNKAWLANVIYSVDNGDCEGFYCGIFTNWAETPLQELGDRNTNLKMKVVNDKIYFSWPGGLGRTELDGTDWTEVSSYNNVGWEDVSENIVTDIEADEDGDLYLYSAWPENIEKDRICQ